MNPRKAFAEFAQGRDFGGREYGRGRHGCSPFERLAEAAEAHGFFGRGGFGHHGFGHHGFGGWGGFGGPEDFGGRGRRGRGQRGDSRGAVLQLLAEQPRTGYQLMQAIAEQSEGRWVPGPETIYPVLQQLEDEGLIQAESEGGQKRYSLTETGKGAAQESGGKPWEANGEAQPRQELFGQAHKLKGAIMGMVHASEAQQKQAAQILEQTRRALYQILAQADEALEDEGPTAGDSAAEA